MIDVSPFKSRKGSRGVPRLIRAVGNCIGGANTYHGWDFPFIGIRSALSDGVKLIKEHDGTTLLKVSHSHPQVLMKGNF